MTRTDMHTTRRRNLAASLGRWSAGHRLAAIGIWVAFVAVAILVGSAAGTDKITTTEGYSGQSKVAQSILEKAGFQQPAAEAVLVQTPTGSTGDAAVHLAVADLVAVLRNDPDVTDVSS